MHNVTHDVMEKIHRYVRIIESWKQKVNITSKCNGRQQFYHYISEAVALTQLLPKDKSLNIVDVGSGAGFPGLIVAILGYYNICLVETNAKKVVFLQHAMAEIGIKARIYQCDIRKFELQNVQYIVSKAFASTNIIVNMCEQIITPQTSLILCKGKQQADEEINEITCYKHFMHSYQHVLLKSTHSQIEHGFLCIKHNS